ncbi:glucoamylase family protein [Sediminicola luteus]|uniref:Glucoamylase family protein n=1 Tax=Sediminicola luteus TaxID=319238 RepID=A0ABV2TY59_9FLAO
MSKFFYIVSIVLFLTSCTSQDDSSPVGVSELPDKPEEPTVVISDVELMDIVQRETFKYFWDYADADSGGARERYHPSEPNLGKSVVTSGGTGFGLMSILVGIERSYISRDEAVVRLSKILAFLENADRFHGAWPHWINGTNGSVIPFSSLDNGGDLVETAFLVQGLICIKEYFKTGSTEEKALSQKADVLWKGVDWQWYTKNENTLYWHWSPSNQFAMNMQLKGYNETLIPYVLAAASPDYSITPEVYSNGWASNGAIKSNNTQFGFPLLVKHSGNEQFGGPLFWAHYSYLGLNPNGLTDQYVNYWDTNVNHSKINYSYCVSNPNGYRDYGKDCWGLTASYTRNSDGGIGYNAHSPNNDTGIISPTAAISSIPYTPTESLAAMHFFYGKKDKLMGPAGFYDAFSPSNDYWVAKAYLAIDQGPIVIMIENYRSGLLWNLFMQNEEVQNGLVKLGFNTAP